VRKLLRALDQAASPLAQQVRAALSRDDDYASSGKPPCDWDDPAAQEALVDDLVRDCLAALEALEDNELSAGCAEAAEIVAIVSGQDVEQGDDGVFRIARGVARDRMISTVDPEARHGHKSRNRRFDGYKAHLSIDPDSELIDEVVATPANTPDRDAVPGLLGATTTTRTSPSSSVTPPMRTPRPAPSSRPMASSSSPSPRRSATQRACSQRTSSSSTQRN